MKDITLQLRNKWFLTDCCHAWWQSSFSTFSNFIHHSTYFTLLLYLWRSGYLVKKIIPVNCFLNGKKIIKEIKKPQPTIFIHTWKPVSSTYLKEECIIFAKKSLLQNPWGKKEMQFRNPIIHKLRIIFNWIALIWVPFILITPSKSLIKKIVQPRHVLCTGSIKVVFPLAWTRIKLQKRLNFLHSIVNPPHFCNLPRLKITPSTPRPTSLSIYSLAQ